MSDFSEPINNFVKLLQDRAATIPDKIIYRYLINGENDEITLSYQQLDQSARTIASGLLRKGVPGDRALLLYPDGLEFIKAFFACLYAGIIAVPAFPPKRNQKMQRLQAIIDDCKPNLLLTEQKTQDIVSSLFSKQENDKHCSLLITNDSQWLPLDADIEFPPIDSQALAFLQYTSGSTGDPKGVMVSHANLLANVHTLKQFLPNGPNKVIVSWLPMFHDMGLIGGILLPLFAAFPVILMSPTAFLQKPLRWLQAISRFKACISVAPNMAYDLCVQSIPQEEISNLNLSHWQVAFNGSEPVRVATLEAFCEKFVPCGFSRSVFSPCYGMAETTLIMTGKPVGKIPSTCKHGSMLSASCGQVGNDHQLRIVNPNTCQPCADNIVGEIWVRGPSITQGYWQRPEINTEIFAAYIGDEGPFLRTGDLGFMHQNELFVTGRLKDLIIIRGRNYYPQDIEACVANSHVALAPNAGAAFSIDKGGAEKLVVVQEIKRSFVRNMNDKEIFSAIRQHISEFHELEVDTIVLIKPFQIPKTSSGKIQRKKCQQQFLAQTLNPISQCSSTVKAVGTIHQPKIVPKSSHNVRKSVQQIQRWLQEKCAEILQVPVNSIEVDVPFAQFGLDSVMAVQISFELEEWLDISLSPTLIYDFPSIAMIAGHLGAPIPKEAEINNAYKDDLGKTIDQNVEKNQDLSEAIAIIGMSCRLPKASGIEDFWRLLNEGIDATETVPSERWNIESIYNPDPDMPGSCYHKRGAFIANIDQFDADFFGIAGREANSLDPQQRLLLEMSWEALENANIVPASLKQSKTGVFIGHAGSEYPYVNGYTTETNGYLLTGQMASTCAGRISYTFDLKGPNYAVDTACSSSLTSIHLACQSLNLYESDLAIAGGITLLLTPRIFIEFSCLRASAVDGRCKSFSNAADGAGWGDGAGLLILKRLQDAQRDGDKILAIIRGCAVNQDGRSAGLTTPNGPSQQQVIQQALTNAKLRPEDIDYIEAHGTGTSLGDPIEANALTEVFKARSTPLYLGSVKSNLGHTMAAAGVTGVIKTVLALQYERLPKTLHADPPSAHVNWAASSLELLQTARPWTPGKRVRRAGISSFGLSGTNAHVILEEAPASLLSPYRHITMSADHSMPTNWPLVLSAKTVPALLEKIEQLRCFVADKAPNPWELAYTLATRRSQFAHRAAMVIDSELLQIEKSILAEKMTQASITVPRDWKLYGTVFLFTGQGSQWTSMGQALYEQLPFFQQTLNQILIILNTYLKEPVFPPTRLIWDADLLASTRYTQPALFALQVALARLWQSWGVQPDILLGHSVGEIAAAHIAGVFSLETACQLVVTRGELMASLCQPGSMASIGASEAFVQAEVEKVDREGQVVIANINTPQQCVISGQTEAVNRLIEKFKIQGVKVQRLSVSHAFHSPMMQPMLEAFERTLESFEYHQPNYPLISSMSGQLVSNEIASAAYWVKQAISPVRFVSAMGSVKQNAANLFIEIGPHPVLSALGTEFTQGQYVWLPSLRKQQKDVQVINKSLAMAFMHGVCVDWNSYFKPWQIKCLDFPCYPFQRQRYWLDKADTRTASTSLATTQHPLLGNHSAIAGTGLDLFISEISINQLTWLGDHQVFKHNLMPAAALLELSYSALKHLGFDATQGWVITNFSILHPLALSTEPVRVQLTVQNTGDETQRNIAIYSQALHLENASWQKISSAQLNRVSMQEMPSVSLPVPETPGIMIKKLYEDFARYGLNYGPAFQGLKQAWHIEDAVWGRVELSEAFSTQSYHIHPALLDASLHCCMVLAQAMQIDNLYLPIAVGEFCLYQNACSSIWVKATLAQSPQLETLEFTIELYDYQGCCIGYLRKFVTKRVDATVLLNSLKTYTPTTAPKISDALMQIEWRALTPLEQSASANNRTIILSAEQTQPALIELLSTLTENDCVALRWSSTASLDSATDLNQQGLAQLQILVQTNTPAIIVWVTEGTHIFAGEQHSALAARGLWGLARVARSEHPQLKLKLLDITPQCHLDESILNALIAHRNEPEFALRKDKLYVPRLTHLQTSANPLHIRNDGTVLITGGLGALGRHVAHWLAKEHKIKHLLLASRRGMNNPQAQDFINGLQDLGVSAEVVQCDVSDKAQVAKLFAKIPADKPLRGIYHTAGLLADNLLQTQTAEQLAIVFKPKVLGAWHLHEFSQQHELDSFVLYSSFASVIGSAGQANYAAANQCLESLAAYRHQQKLPATAIAWGYWSDASSTMTGQLHTRDIARVERFGLEAIDAQLGTKLLEYSLAQDLPAVIAAPLDAQKLNNYWGDSSPALFAALLQSLSNRTDKQTSSNPLLNQLAQMSASQREAVLLKRVREQIAIVLDHTFDKVAADVHLKDLGMDSLMAVEIRNRLITLTGINLDADTLFTLTSAAKITRFLNDRLLQNQSYTINAILRQQPQAHYPLSSNQARLWFLQQLDPSSIAYSEPVVLDLVGEVKIVALKKAFELLVERHAVFRTNIRDVDGLARQFVVDESSFQFEVLYLDQTNSKEQIQQQEQLYNRIFQTPFDLSKDALIRAALIYYASDRLQLLVNFHHIITDATSIKLFFSEFVSNYNALAQNNIPNFVLPTIQYTDYTIWQQSSIAQADTQIHLAYWQNQLKDASYLSLPYKHLSNEVESRATISHQGSKVSFNFSESTISQLNAFCRDHDLTLHMVLLGTLTLLLSKYSGQKDICIGGPTLGRNRQEMALLQGFFANTIVYRNWVINEQSFLEFMQAVKSTCIEAFQHQDCPFDEVVKSLDLIRTTTQNPLFQVMFNVLEAPQSWDLNLLGVYIKLKDYHNHSSKFNLSLCFLFSQTQLKGEFEFNTDLFSQLTIERMAEHFDVLLTQLLSQADMPIKHSSFITPHEKQQLLVEWNDTSVDFCEHQTIHSLFEAQAARSPDRIALIHGEQRLTYAELNKRSNQLAHYLKEHGVAPNQLVALCTARSIDMVIGIIGILKAGGAYVPLDPAYPTKRLRFMLADTGLNVVLSQRTIASKQLLFKNQDLVLLDDDNLVERLSNYPDTNPEHSTPTLTSRCLAYVIYTSGSMGKPKGVMIEHRSVNRLVLKANYVDLNTDSVILQAASPSFDAMTFELWGALLNGGTLVLHPEVVPTPAGLQHEIINHGVSHLWLTAGLFNAIVNENISVLRGLKQLLVGGEALSVQHINLASAALPDVELINGYGPTESTTFAVCYKINKEYIYINNVPIGRPISNTRLYVLSDTQQLVPVGVPGELYIGGKGLARGYLNQPELTAEKFIINPFTNNTDDRLYRTGDRVRYLTDGNLEYIGRNDTQVKLRGFRIELSEIENILQLHKGIAKAAVLVREKGGASSKELVAYIVANKLITSVLEIREFLEERIPHYMVPEHYLILDNLPLTSNGKLDRKSLSKVEFISEKRDFVLPKNELEIKISEIWAEVLGLATNEVGIRDDFFRLGGDSIVSIQLVSRLRQRLGINVSVKDIFEFKSIERLCNNILAKKQTDKLEIKTEQGVLSGEVDLLPIQEWFFSSSFTHSHHWNQSFLLKVPLLEVEKLIASIERLIHHHDAFRLRYKKILQNQDTGNNQYLQYYDATVGAEKLKLLDLSTLRAKEGSVKFTQELDKIFTKWQSGFNLETGPTYSVGYIHGYTDGSARIYFALHHLTVDTVSWRILVEDLKELYAGHEIGSKFSSYRQWVEAISGYRSNHDKERVYWDAIIHDYTHSKNNLTKLDVSKTSRSLVNFSLTPEQTRELLQLSNQTYHTQINDLLLTALGYSLSELTENKLNYIVLEGHGRNELSSDIDITRTVGWFTTMYPVKLEIEDDIGSSIKRVKEDLRSIPNMGIGYGALIGYGSYELPKISFNYLGQFDKEQNILNEKNKLIASEGLWNVTDESSGIAVDLLNQDNSIININGFIINGKLTFSINSKLTKIQTEKFATRFANKLKDVINHTNREQRTYLTVSDISNIIEQAHLDRLQQFSEIENIYLANSLQQGFIYHSLTQGEIDDAYKVQIIWNYHDELDTDKLKQAWKSAQAKYEVLRLRFDWEDDLLQIIDKNRELPWHYIDLSEEKDIFNQELKIQQIQQQDRQENYNLNTGNLFKVYLIKRKTDLYTCIFSNHHVILDGWSNPVLLGYVHEIYLKSVNQQNIESNVNTIYGEAQKYLQQLSEDNEAYWKEYLSKIKSRLDLSGLLKENKHQVRLSEYRHVLEPKEQCLIIDNELFKKIKAISQDSGFTLNAVLQYIWHNLLSIYGNTSQTMVGATVSGRNLPINNIENGVGLFINTLPLIVEHTQEKNTKTIKSKILEMQEAINTLNEKSNVCLAKLHKKGERLFDSLFVYENYPMPTKTGTKHLLKIEFKKSIEKLDYPLGVVAYEVDNRLVFKLNYAGELFAEETIATLLQQVKHLIQQIVQDVNLPIAKLNLLSPEQYQKIIYEWNKSDSDYLHNKTVQELFEEQTLRTPDKIAVIYKDKKLTYTELNTKANQLANYLRNNYQIVPNDLIALCLVKSELMVIAILGILKTGSAYLPIDPDYPAERIGYILEDTHAKIILTNETYQKNLISFLRCEVLAFDSKELQNKFSTESSTNLKTITTSSHLIYVMYTSGTTGRPKGVLQTHMNVVQKFLATEKTFEFSATDTWTLYHSYAFDFSVWEQWGALLYGGKLIIPTQEQGNDLSEFHQLCIDHGVTILNQTPRSFYQFAEIAVNQSSSVLTKLRHVILGGEKLNHQHLSDWFAYVEHHNLNTCLFNMYGITETIHTTLKLLSAKEQSSSNIGKPFPGTKVYVLGEERQILPIGVIGELYIGGMGLAPGYWNRAELTAERFIPNPFANLTDRDKNDSRLYKTGDLVRWLPNGDLEYIGRNDFQVKLRGFRIELGEIECALKAISALKEAAVIATQGANKDTKQLVAYVVPTKPITGNQDEINKAQQALVTILRDQLQRNLPGYMVPQSFIVLDNLPLTSNGKLDRAALPTPNEKNSQQATYTPPTSKVEQQLCDIWQDVLKLDRVGIHDNFFEVGGDSILSIQMVARAKRQGLTLTIRQLFDYPTIADIIPTLSYQKVINAPQEPVMGRQSLLPIQQCFFDLSLTDQHHFKQSMLLRTPIGFTLDHLKILLKLLYQRHDVLRLQFKQKGNEWLAEYHPYDDEMITSSLFYENLSDLQNDKKNDKLKNSCEILQASLDLEKGRLLKVAYFFYGAETNGRLFLVLHHLIVDSVSWRILCSDLNTAYRKLINAEPVAHSPKSSSLQQWGEALREHATSPVLLDERSYWLKQLAYPTETIPDLVQCADNIKDEIHGYSCTLSEEETRLILGECNKVYRTKVNELLIAALFKAYQDWSKQPTMCLMIEGHGREDLFDTLDITETVGWLTSIYPLLLSSTFNQDLAGLIKSVKEQCRSVPRNGIGYGILTKIVKDAELCSLESSHQSQLILFNYLGNLDNLLNEDMWFYPANESTGSDTSPKQSQNVLIAINGHVSNEKLSFLFTGSSKLISPKAIADFCDAFKKSLENCILWCTEIKPSQNLKSLRNKVKLTVETVLSDEGIEI